MSHLRHLDNPHRALLERLRASTAALPEPTDARARAGLRELLEILFRPEDAALAAQMPVLPATLAQVARQTGMAPEQLEARLEAMCDRGLVMDLVSPSTGEVRYFLAPPVVGFFEFSLMRVTDTIPQERLARALDAYVHLDDSFAREVFGHATVIGRTLVHENRLGPELETEVLDWERASAVVREARAVAVSLCYCRHKAHHAGRACEAPLENCLSLDAGADFVTRHGFGRAIERRQALELLAAAREHGLVHIADNVQQQPSYLCNCCGCCCDQLLGIRKFGLAAVNPSRFQAHSKPDRCSGCGLCAQACPVGAIATEPRVPGAPAAGTAAARRARVDPDRCLGCGVCLSACKRGAMTLVPRADLPYVPQSSVEKALRMAIERGRLAHLVFDEGAGRGFRVLNRMLAALLRLPPVEKALANEQLRSRFIRFALSQVGDPTA